MDSRELITTDTPQFESNGNSNNTSYNNLAMDDNLSNMRKPPNNLGLHEVRPNIHQHLVEPFTGLNRCTWLAPKKHFVNEDVTSRTDSGSHNYSI